MEQKGGGSWGLCILWCVCGFFTLISCQGNLEGQAKLQLSCGEQSAAECRSGAIAASTDFGFYEHPAKDASPFLF